MAQVPQNITQVMADATLRGLLNEFLTGLRAQENSMFLYAVMNYKQVSQQEVRNIQGKKIRDLYVAEDSKNQVNLPSAQREDIMAVAANAFRQDTFNEAEREIKGLINSNYWIQFIKHLKANHGYNSTSKLYALRRLLTSNFPVNKTTAITNDI